MKDEIVIKVKYFNNEVCYRKVCESIMTAHKEFQNEVFDVESYLEDIGERIVMRVCLYWGNQLLEYREITRQ